jgi:hypothetical protein
MKKRSLTRALAMVGTIAAIPTAQAVDWQAGDWTLGLGGNVNAYFTHTSCSPGDLQAGGVTLAGLACPTSGDKNAVNNGLLPASLNFSAATTQNGIDLSAHIDVYYGIDSAGTNGDANADDSPDALKFSTVDARQVYLTFGTPTLGTIKAGRAYGLFAYDAIVNDMSLLGAGAAFTTANPGHTTLGGLGFGYVYTDRLAQIDWISPKWNGFQGTLGIFNPLDGQAEGAAKAVGESEIGYQGKLSYDWEGTVPGYLSVSGISQKIVVEDAEFDEDGNIIGFTKTGNSSIQGWDVFGKVSYSGFGLDGYYYSGKGMSTLALGGLIFDGFSASATAEESRGGYVQGTYTWNNTKFGAHWSQSKQTKLDKVENERLTLGVYHNLTPALTLLAEYNTMKSELDTGEDKTGSIDVGAILFF